MAEPEPPDSASPPHRKRLRRRDVDMGVRFLTFSCYQRLPLLGTPPLRRVFVDALRRALDKGRFELIAWVIMPEHVHLLVRPEPGSKWAPIAAGLKTSVAKRILNRWQEIDAPILLRLRDVRGDPHFWQPGGGFDRNVRHETELCKEIRYIHHNPVERGLAGSPTGWAWSSARFWTARHERWGDLNLGRARDDPASLEEWWTDDGGPACDWPPGDWRAWAAWTGFK